MTTVSTPRYLLDQARRRLTPTLNTIPGMGMLDERLRDTQWPEFVFAEPPPGSGLKPVMGNDGLPVLGHLIEVFRGGPDYVLWMIDFDDSRQCDHVNYVNKNDGSLSTPTPNTAAEDEYLFAPYGTFTVTGAAFQPTGTVSEANPHVVTLRAAVNNRSEREDVQSAPWA